MESHAGRREAGPPGPAHPYLDWAIETGFAYLRPGEWLPLLVEFDEALPRSEFISLKWLNESLKDAVRVPELFREVSNAVLESPEFNFCVILIHRERAAELVRDSAWKQTIRSAELGPPVELKGPVATSAAPSERPVTKTLVARAEAAAAPRGWIARLRSRVITTPVPTSPPMPAPLSPPERPGAGTQGAAANGQRVVTAVIDQGIAFAHPRFCHANGTRVSHLWQQDLMSSTGIPDPAALTKAAIDAALQAAMVDTPGLELTAAAIDAGMQAARAQGGDEDLVYRAVGRLDFSVDGFKSLARRRSHGTHVLDLAAGEDSQLSGALRPIIAVDMPEEAVGDPAGSSLTIHAAWGLMYILARAEAMRNAGERLPVVVNLSYGPHDGPHDGSSLFERFADGLINLFANTETPLRIVLGAGNFRQSRAHASFQLPVAGVQPLHWRLQPCGLTPSFIEIWLPTTNGSAVSVTLTSPRGDQVTVSPAKLSDVFPLPGAQQIGARYVPAGPWSPRSSVILSVVPTALDPSGAAVQPIAPSGLWTVTVTNLPNSPPLDIDSWIKRTDTPGGRRAKGRQSYFDDPNYRRFVEVPAYPCDRPTGPMNFDPDNSSYVRRQGTLSGITTGAETYVIGGYCRKPKPWNLAIHDPLNPMPVSYSSEGPVAPNAARTMKAPNWLGPSDDAPSCPGVLAAGTRSGSRVAMNGTSAAAPQAARYYAEQFATNGTWGPDPPAGLFPVSNEVPAIDRPLVAGDGLMDLPSTRNLRKEAREGSGY